jgi:hypothetical protein
MGTDGTAIQEHLEGTGTLKSKMAPTFAFEVAYSVTFQISVERLPMEPRLRAKEGHVVHYIRSVDDRNIPNGEYDLVTMPTGSASEYIHVGKMQDKWEILPYESEGARQ